MAALRSAENSAKRSAWWNRRSRPADLNCRVPGIVHGNIDNGACFGYHLPHAFPRKVRRATSGGSHSQQNRFASEGKYLFTAPSHFAATGSRNCTFWEGTWASRL